MTAKEALSNCLAAGAMESVEYFLYLASHADELRTSDGQRLNDNTDFAVFLREFAEALCPFVEKSPPAHHSTCHSCGHIHTEDDECGMFMGTSAGYCRCGERVGA
jgi:hypothetical protein